MFAASPAILGTSDRQVPRSTVIKTSVDEFLALWSTRASTMIRTAAGTARHEAEGPDRLAEWRHSGGHRWRFELEALVSL